MKHRHYVVIAVALSISLVLIGCSSAPPSVQTLGAGQNTVTIRADDNSFEPNVIQVAEPGELTLEVTNVSGNGQNITVESPSGQVIGSRDIPPGQTVLLTVDLNQQGTYTFYSNRLLGAQLGMRGSISVGR